MKVDAIATILTVLHLLRDTEVRDLDTALVVYEHVRAFDVTMYDIALVQVVQAEENLPNPVANERLLECTVATQQRRDRVTWDILQEDVEMVTINA